MTGLAAALAAPRHAPAQQPDPVRYTCFYQIGRQVIDVFAAADTGLPAGPGYLHIFAHSHASVFADPSLADYIHQAGDNFRYAPAFDLHKYDGWRLADESQLAAWATDFRDTVLACGADYFSFNELPSNTPTDPQARASIATLLTYLAEPDANGNRLSGVLFMTHAPSMPANWSDPASDFWQCVDQTCDLVVAEHYHGNGFICQNTDTYLQNHFFAMWDWLFESQEPAKISVALGKFTVLHSARYGPGPSGWQGADSDVVPFDVFQRDLARCARITRNGAGGSDRIAFAPLAAVYTDPSVVEYLSPLINWHYNQGGTDAELQCFGGDPAACSC